MVGDKANAKDKKNVEVASKPTRQGIHIHKAQHGKYQSQAVALPNQGSVRCQAYRKVLVHTVHMVSNSSVGRSPN